MTKRRTKDSTCVLCGSPNVVPDSGDLYCMEHWEEWLDLTIEAQHRFECHRVARGADYERYHVDHPKLGEYCAELIVMHDICGKFHVKVLLHEDIDWSKPAFQREGDPECVPFAELMMRVPLRIAKDWHPERVYVESLICSGCQCGEIDLSPDEDGDDHGSDHDPGRELFTFRN